MFKHLQKLHQASFVLCVSVKGKCHFLHFHFKIIPLMTRIKKNVLFRTELLYYSQLLPVTMMAGWTTWISYMPCKHLIQLQVFSKNIY